MEPQTTESIDKEMVADALTKKLHTLDAAYRDIYDTLERDLDEAKRATREHNEAEEIEKLTRSLQ